MIKKVTKKQNNAKMCLICGVDNAQGMHAFFYELEDGSLVGVANAQAIHQSYPGRVHGGAITALLDETIGRAVNIEEPDVWGVTVSLSTRYRKPVPYDATLLIVGRITESNRHLFKGEGTLILPDGQIAATASATYMKLPLEKIADFDPHGEDWRVYPDEHDPAFFDLPEGV